MKRGNVRSLGFRLLAAALLIGSVDTVIQAHPDGNFISAASKQSRVPGPKVKSRSGIIRYTIHKQGTGPQLKLGDTVQIHFVLLNHVDSVIQSTYANGRPEITPVIASEHAGDPISIFPQLHEGDSLTMEILADSFFKANSGNIPPMFESGKDVRIQFKIVKVLDAADLKQLHAEFDARREQYMEEQKLAMEEGKRLMRESISRDSSIIQEYLKKNKLTTVARRTPEGVYYIVTRKGRGRQPANGQLLNIRYKGMLLDGTVFDESRNEEFQFTLGAHQVIPGFESGFVPLTEGTQAILLIPSHLAYGPHGSPPTIPGNAVLRFDVELRRIAGDGKK